MSKNRPLTIGVEGDELVIRIGISTLEYAANQTETFAPWSDPHNDWVTQFRVVNQHKFAEGIGHALRDEGEDGSTPLTRLLDTSFLYAVEGDYGVEEIEMKPPERGGFVTKNIKDGETVCEHGDRPFECATCKINSATRKL